MGIRFRPDTKGSALSAIRAKEAAGDRAPARLRRRTATERKLVCSLFVLDMMPRRAA